MNAFQRAARWFISRATTLTPSVAYYADGWPAQINGVLTELAAKKDASASPMTMAAISLCCAMHEHLTVGDTATVSLTGVTHGDHDVGDFIVTLQRL